MGEEKRTRRTVLKLGGTVGAVALAGCGDAESADEPADDTTDGDQEDGTTEGDDTAAGENRQTGEESTEQTANNINVIGQIGTVNAAGEAIETVGLTVQRAPGSDDIDLTALSIQYVGDNGFANFIHASTVEEDAAAYYLETIVAETENGVITDDGDRYQLVIPFGTAARDEDLASSDPAEATQNYSNDLTPVAAGEEAELEITTDAGATRRIEIAVPDELRSDERVRL